jgi:hypothetical protein
MGFYAASKPTVLLDFLIGWKIAPDVPFPQTFIEKAPIFTKQAGTRKVILLHVWKQINELAGLVSFRE